MEADTHTEGQSHSAVMKGVKTATFYGWKYKHYFVVVEEGENNLRAWCTLCPPSKKPLSSARNTTSNFKKHLDTVHRTTALVEIARDTEGDSCTLKQKRNHKDVEIVAPEKTVYACKQKCNFTSKSKKFNIRVCYRKHVATFYCRITSIKKVSEWCTFGLGIIARQKIFHSSFR